MSKGSAAERFDPVKAWRDWFVKSERQWSEALTTMMKDDAVARAVGQEVNATLYGQQMLKQGMARPLAMFNLPSHENIVTLGERIGRLEDAVARVEAGLLQLRGALGADTPKPGRGRRAPAGAAPDEAAATPPKPRREPARQSRR